MSSSLNASSSFYAETIRIRGIVQGVGFRPMIWSEAKKQQLQGDVANDGEGVLIQVYGSITKITAFVAGIEQHCPPLAQIDSIERKPLENLDKSVIPQVFSIIKSKPSKAHTHLPADAATCLACIKDINNANNRRYQYAFTNCTHCGPRLSIIQGIPYDRDKTTMSVFELCEDCRAEYQNPNDRRFHAQPNACAICGPKLWLEKKGHQHSEGMVAIEKTATLLKQGKIIAIKGIAGIHLAVDASNEEAILRLRQRKQRPNKPLALMARDIRQIKKFCYVSQCDAQLLSSAAAPIVLLAKKANPCNEALFWQLAPNQAQLGFMLPYSPLHHLLMQQLEQPIVLTSGNLSNEPQCIENTEADKRLSPLADAFLLHNRVIENRLDDSVLYYSVGKHRLLRRARGYAPHPIKFPNDFATAPEILAMGSEMKNTFCLFKKQQAIVSQHIGDLENYATYIDYEKNLALYQQLYQHQAKIIVVDKHPEYLSSKLGRAWAKEKKRPLIEVQHHHAHIAACLIENQQPLNAPQVLGIALDGLGYGDHGALWGGEFLLADYTQANRIASLLPVPLIGGTQAMKEPWRNTYAHLQTCKLWNEVARYDLDIVNYLKQKPLKTLNKMIENKINSPLASSCGRLFDAVAGAIGICTDSISYEGQAAIEMEALLAGHLLDKTDAYPFALQAEKNIIRINPRPMWQALFSDLLTQTPHYLIVARFHYGLANILITLGLQLAKKYQINQIVLTGGVFQNKTLLEAVHKGLSHKVTVLTHAQFPANDGGISLGQIAIASSQFSQKN